MNEQAMNESMIARHLSTLGTFEIRFSNKTNKFYVTISAEIGGNGTLTSPTEHRDNPNGALFATFNRFRDAEFIVVDAYTPKRHEFKWNGICFARC